MEQGNVLTQKRTPENIFLYLGLFFGLIFIFIIPPFQNCDESNHFFRSYQISGGVFKGTKAENISGGFIPTDLVAMADSLEQQSPGTFIAMHPERKIDISRIARYRQKKCDENKLALTDFRNTVLLTPFVYLPQSTGIGIARLLRLPMLWMFYIGRLFNLLAYISLIYFSIRKIPIFKWGMILFALVPITLSLAASYSADAITIAIAFTMFSEIIAAIAAGSKISLREKRRLLFLSLLLGLCKPAYSLINLLLLLIPRNRWSSQKHFIGFSILFLFTPFAIYFFWMQLVKNIYIPYYEFVDPIAQSHFILNHPLLAIRIWIYSDLVNIKFLMYSFIGSLGWADTFVPKYLVAGYFIIFLLNALTEAPSLISINFRHRVLALFILLLSILYIDMVMYLSATAAKSSFLSAINGRYFIPFAPVILVIFCNSSLRLKNFRHYMEKIILPFFISITLAATVWAILYRYYCL